MIRNSPDGRYFVDADGRPFFWLGDTQWELFRCFTLEDAGAVLRSRREQGFSVVQVMITGVGDGTAPDLEGEMSWVGGDPARPNEAYFRRVDAVVERARREGLILVLGVYHQLQVDRITAANARAYARWMARRYREAPHLVWTAYPKATPEFVPVLRELAAGLKEGDEGRHMITVHPDPSPASSSFIHEEPWLDFNSIQTWVTYDLIDGMVRDDYARVPAKPVVMAEGGYEGEERGDLRMPLAIRKQAYWTHLAGGHYSYGHDDNWRSPGSWRDWIDSPGARAMGIYRQIVTSPERWWDRVPDPAAIADGRGGGMELNTAARSAEGDWLLAYLCGAGPVTLRMDRIDGKGAWASWIDPSTGRKTPIAAVPTDGDRSFTKPEGWDDAVLLVEAQEPA